jgi:hypothetical protein
MLERKARVSIAVATVLALLSGCEGLPQDRNSQAGEEWGLGAELEILAGALDSPPESSFDQVAGVARFQDGEIVVLDGGMNSRITVLSPSGEFLRTIGRNGEGPGEFGWVTSVQAGADDSLFVFDAGLQRLTVFSPDGSSVRSADYRPVEGERLRTVTHLGGNTWLGRGMDTPLQAPLNQIVQDTIILGLLDPTLEQLDLVATLPSLMSTGISIGGQIGLGAAAFTPIALHATSGGCIFVSTADTSSIQVYSSDGEYLKSFEGPGARRPVTREHVEDFVENRLRGAPEDQQRVFRPAFLDAAHAESLPYYFQMLADPWGYLWLQEYSPPVGLGSHWYVVTPTGRVVTEFVLPASIRVYGIDEDGLLGMKRGEFDEEMIVGLPIVSRPEGLAEPLSECQPHSG